MQTNSSIRVIIADDHEIFRDGFNVMIKKSKKVEIVGEAENGEQIMGLGTIEVLQDGFGFL